MCELFAWCQFSGTLIFPKRFLPPTSQWSSLHFADFTVCVRVSVWVGACVCVVVGGMIQWYYDIQCLILDLPSKYILLLSSECLCCNTLTSFWSLCFYWEECCCAPCTEHFPTVIEGKHSLVGFGLSNSSKSAKYDLSHHLTMIWRAYMFLLLYAVTWKIDCNFHRDIFTQLSEMTRNRTNLFFFCT